MIVLYSGTPGSGKSLHCARDIYLRLRFKRDIIATFPVNLDLISDNGKKKIGKFIYKDYSELTVDYLVKYAMDNHKLGVEGQTLVVIDECQIIFNPRQFDRKDRLEWITFFTQHRKLGYNFILITQFDRLVDRQIRALIEFEYKHLKNNNNGFIGMLLPIPLFSYIKYWYCVKERITGTCFFYRKKYADIYDSYKFFEESISKEEKKDNVSLQNILFR